MPTTRLAALYATRPWWHKPLVWTAWGVAAVMGVLCAFIVMVRADVLALDRAVCQAAANGEAWKVRLAIAVDPRLADMSVYSRWVWTPLHKAASGGHWRVVDDLIESGAEANSAEWGGWTALHEAAWRGRIDVMESLVKHGAAREAVDDSGMTPLAWAVIAGRRRTARWLASKGARGDVASPDGMTAVYAATRFSDASMLRIALTKTKDIDGLSEEGITALHRAAFAGDARKVALLLASGADCNARTRGWEPVRTRAMPPVPPDVRAEGVPVQETVIPWLEDSEHDGATPLHCAAACGSQQIAKMLLARGADPSAVTACEQTPADWAEERGYRRLARTLSDAAPGRRAPVTSTSSSTSGGST